MLICLLAPRTFLIARVGAFDATLARRVDRLQYLRRLLLRAPESLLAALQAEQGTVCSRRSQISLNLLLVRQFMPGLAHLPFPSSATLRLVRLHSFAGRMAWDCSAGCRVASGTCLQPS